MPTKCATREAKDGHKYVICYKTDGTVKRKFKVKPGKKKVVKKVAPKKVEEEEPTNKRIKKMKLVKSKNPNFNIYVSGDEFKNTPPILPVNEKNAKKLLDFMSKKYRENSPINTPAMGWDYYKFKFDELEGGNLFYTMGGQEYKLEIKKIMKFLKDVKSGKEKDRGTHRLPSYYKDYLNQLDVNPSISAGMLFHNY